MAGINRHSKLPYYQQLYDVLRGNIQRGEWQPGELIPPESVLMQDYQLSRNTVRQVLDMLVNDGLIYRQRGRGSFVSHPTLEKSMMRIVSFTEDMKQRGFTAGTVVLSSSLIPAPADISEQLDVSAGTELARIVRKRLADEEPMSLEESYLVHSMCPDVLRNDYSKVSLKATLESKFGLKLVRAKQVIKAISSDRSLADLLGIKLLAPILLIERVTYSQYDKPVEFLKIFYRADRYALYSELQG